MWIPTSQAVPVVNKYARCPWSEPVHVVLVTGQQRQVRTAHFHRDEEVWSVDAIPYSVPTSEISHWAPQIPGVVPTL